MHIAARFDARDQQFQKSRLDQATFVVALFMPRVGEKNVRAIKRIGRNHVFQHFHGIVLNDADIG